MRAKQLFDWIRERGWDGVTDWLAPPGEPESQHLEFKGADMRDGPGVLSASTKADVGKAMSGLANAEGGLIVIGVSAQAPDDGGDDRAMRLRPITGVSAVARTLRSLINKLTDPDIRGADVLELSDPEDTSRGVVVVYVPLTSGGPFRTCIGLIAPRAKDRTEDFSRRFYLRVGVHTDVMSTTTLGAMFGQRSPPVLRLVVQCLIHPGNRNADITLALHNIGRSPAIRPAVHLTRIPPLKELWVTPRVDESRWILLHGASADEAQGDTYQARGDVVVYPGQRVIVERVMPTRPANPEGPQPIRGVMYAMDMQPIQFAYDLPLLDGEHQVELPLSE